jgi:hypothetical protein
MSTPNNKQRNYWVWLIAAIAVVSIACIATNPDQAAHLQAIKDTVRLRDSDLYGTSDFLYSMIQYQNHVIYSEMTLGAKTYSLGVLGKVYTTDDIRDFHYDLHPTK